MLRSLKTMALQITDAGTITEEVVAESVAQANAAAAVIEVDYAPLPAVAGTKHATDGGAPQIWDAAPGNRCFVWADGDAAMLKRIMSDNPGRLYGF